MTALPNPGILSGQVVALRFDGHTRYLWWGPGADDLDRVASADGQVLVWASEAECVAAAAESGWPCAADGDSALVAEYSTTVSAEVSPMAAEICDVDPAFSWIARRRLSLDPDPGLMLWNFAADVARSTGRRWSDRGRVRDECYDLLLLANVPWSAGRDAFSPRWTAHGLTVLRAVLTDAAVVLRASVPIPERAEPARSSGSA